MLEDQNTGTRLRSLYTGDGGVCSVFSTKVADYVASRPDYPAALFETLKAICPPSGGAMVADIGAGTGLLTGGLLRSGYRVLAVEPNPEMRQAADHLLGGVDGYKSVDGCAESIPIDSGSISLITAAQAFHWFDVERAKVEFLRVLTSQGQVALIWNDRLPEDPLHAALDELFNRFGGAKRAALVAHEDRRSVPHFFGSAQCQEFAWPHSHHLGEEAFLSLVFSRSYVPGRSTPEGGNIADESRDIFRRFAVSGIVGVRYRTVAIVGRPG